MLGLLCLNRQGMEGALVQMVNHGLSTGALFLLVGMLYERRHTRAIADFGGLARSMPWFTAVFILVMLSSIGLPGLNGFVGEFLILLGAFREARPFAVIGAVGVVLGAVYMLWMVQRVFFGPVKHEANRVLTDLTRREFAVLLPLLVLIVVLGVYPRPILDRMHGAVNDLLTHVELHSKAERRADRGALQVEMP